MMVRVSGAASARHRLAPEVGADTDDVLREHGGDADTTAALRARGSIK
jgi:crotonobetainyl-CoA:carnitine CoA-transferase CaiB-like acyl-CoA transferase